MRRDGLLLILLLLALALLGGLAWLTRHPGHPAVERAEEWPVVGALAGRFRRAYRPPPARPREPKVAERREIESSRPSPTVGPGPTTATPGLREPIGAAPTIWVPADTPLLEAPRRGAPVVVVTLAIANLEMLEERDGWVRVRRREAIGWFVPESLPGEQPPLGSRPEPVLPLPGRPPDPARLSRGRELLGSAERRADLGPYPLYTDHPDDELIAFLDRLVGGLRPQYETRLGLEAKGEAAEAILLFRDQESYETFQRSDRRLTGLRPSGHAGHGLAALAAGDRERDEIVSTLVHEIVHLLNRRTVGPGLPPWLDEGLADDLAKARIGDDGAIQPGTLGGSVVHRGELRIYHGGLAAAMRLAAWREEGVTPSLEELTALDWGQFVEPSGRAMHYAQSFLWVRYLLSGWDRSLSRDFRAFLAAVSRGGPATADALLAALGRDWPQLEAGFWLWVAAQHLEAPEQELPTARKRRQRGR